jgi:RNA polymerase sigma-70 factor (ECF subfamily)
MTNTLTMADVERLRAVAASDADHVALDMDEESFRGFYERTARVLRAYLARLSDASEADDLLQETYYRFLRAHRSYESEAHRRNALFAIATNVARDRSRRRRVEPSALADPVPADVAGPAGAASSVEQRYDLSRALEQLRPRDRGLLWLAYAHGWSHRELADALGLRVGSVKPLLFRARRKLATLLRREGHGERR